MNVISVSSLEFMKVWSSFSTDCSSSETDSKGSIESFIFESLLLLSLFEYGLYCCVKGKMIGSFG